MVLLIVKNINNIWIKYLSLYLSLWSRIFRIFFEAGFFYLLKLELGIVRWCWIWWRSKESGLIVVPTGFQTDNWKPRCDWLALSHSFPHWLRAPSTQNQFENPSWLNPNSGETHLTQPKRAIWNGSPGYWKYINCSKSAFSTDHVIHIPMKWIVWWWLVLISSYITKGSSMKSFKRWSFLTNFQIGNISHLVNLILVTSRECDCLECLVF